MREPWVVRHPGVVLLIAALVTTGAAWGLTRIEPEVDFVDTVPDHDGLEAYRDMLERLEGIRFVALYHAHDPGSGVGHFRTDNGFDALVREQEAFTAALHEQFPDTFQYTLSAYEGMKAGHYMFWKLLSAGNPPESSYSLPQDPVTWDLVRSEALDGGSLDDVIATDGSSALLLAFLADGGNTAGRAVAGAFDAFVAEWRAGSVPGSDPDTRPSTDHAATGLLHASWYTDTINREETIKWAPLAAGATLLALLWAVRRPTNAAICVVSLGLALVWTYGFMGVFGFRLSFLSLFLAPVVVGIGVDYAVHVLHRYEEERDRGAPRRTALATAVARTGRAVAVAATTTAAGLAVLLLVPAPLFAEIGGLAALGILLGFVAAVTVGPALRAVLPEPRRTGSGHDRVGAALARWSQAVRRRAWPGLLAVLVVTGGAAYLVATQTQIESGAADNEFPQDDPVIALQHRIEQEYGAFHRSYLVVRGDLADPDALLAVYEATQDAAALPLYRNASAVTDLLLADAATRDGFAGIALAALLGVAGESPSDEERLPQTKTEARDALDALFSDPLWRTIAPFTITPDYTLAVVAIQLDPWQDQQELVALRDALQAQADALQDRLGSDYDVAAAGSPINRAAIVEGTPINIAIATLGAAVAVGGVLAALWARRGVEGMRMAGLAMGLVLVASVWLLATVPLLDATYSWLEGFGWTANRAPLTDMFLLAFAVTVAIGVDDVVHLASRYWEARDRGQSKDAAVTESFTHAGRAISATSLTTFAAFAVMAGVYFLQSKNLAILAAAGVLWAYVLTLLLVPRLLAGRSKQEPESPSRWS